MNKATEAAAKSIADVIDRLHVSDRPGLLVAVSAFLYSKGLKKLSVLIKDLDYDGE